MMIQILKFLELLLFPSRTIVRRIAFLTQNIQWLKEDLARQHYVDILFTSSELQQYFCDLFSRLTVWTVRDFPKCRLGGAHDGGYVMLDHFANVVAAYSLGIGWEVSWDLEMARRGISVIQFDDSVRGPPSSHRLFTFERKRIGSARDLQAGLETVEGAVERHHHQGKSLILKMDIDGAEWEVFDGMSEALLRQFDQILCEFHGFCHVSEHAFRTRAARVFDKLNRYHKLIHVHANNTAPLYRLPDFFFSDVYELTYVLSERYPVSESQEIFPGPFDSPNDPTRPDVYLGRFKFTNQTEARS